MDERIKTIANHYGLIHQLYKLSEECSELKEAIDGFLNDKDNIHHLQEEIADVRIVMAQIDYLLGMSNSIDDCVYLKLERQIKRITNEEGDGEEKK